MTRPLSRRAFLKAALHIFGGAAAGGSLSWLYTTQAEPNWLELERVTLAVPGLPEEFDGLRMAHFSDLHLGPFLGVRETRRVVDRVNRLQADVVVFTGDFVSSLEHGEADWVVEAFAPLRAPMGVYAALGNHDHWTDAETVAEAARSAGVTVMRNQGLPLERGRGRLWLAGVDDVWEGQQDLGAALADVPRGTPVVLLAHEPDYADEVALDGRVAVQLSGHSHGGQVRLPYFGAPILPFWGRKYPYGLKRVMSMWVYTNRGIGMVPPPVRFNCRPEVTLFTFSIG